MALVDFKCEKCGASFFEILNKSDEKVICPNCGSDEVKRIYKGKFYGKNSGGCNGSCASCGGCH